MQNLITSTPPSKKHQLQRFGSEILTHNVGARVLHEVIAEEDSSGGEGDDDTENKNGLSKPQQSGNDAANVVNSLQKKNSE